MVASKEFVRLRGVGIVLVKVGVVVVNDGRNKGIYNVLRNIGSR